MYARRSVSWWLAAVGVGACDRCSWTLEYVETAEMGASSGSASSGVETQGETHHDTSSTGDAPGTGGASEDVESSGDAATDTGGSTTSSAETSSADDVGPVAGVCGNGIVEPGEACDDGDRADEDACPSGMGGCVADARCGDGFVHVGEEECEDGNTEDEDECSNDCWMKRRVFITAQVYSGDLGGVDGADAACTQAAQSLKGTYRAWISDSTDSPADRFESEKFRGWYVLTEETPIAHGWVGLTSKMGLLTPIKINQYGHEVSFVQWPYVWSNTGVHGTAESGAHCSDWTGVGMGRVGVFLAMTSKWTSHVERGCADTQAHLYCIEVKPQN